MTEADWLTGKDPAAMLRLVTENPDHCDINCVRSDRKLRLFAVACCRLAWHRLVDDFRCPVCDGGGRLAVKKLNTGWAHTEKCSDCSGTGRVNRSRRAVEVAERYADGQATEEERQRAIAPAFRVAQPLPRGTTQGLAHDCLIDAPMASREFSFLPDAAQAALIRCIFANPFRPTSLSPVGPGWASLYPNAYAVGRRIYEERDFEAMPILADALEEAGAGADVLEHCRGPGPHARGCFVLDLVLGKV